MFRYDYNQPGPSNDTGYTNDPLNIYDYPPPRSSGILTGENYRQTHSRGARQGFNSFHQNQSNLVGFQSWVPPPVRSYPTDSRKPHPHQYLHQKQLKDKRRDFNNFRDKNSKENQNISHYSQFSTDLVPSNELKKQQSQQYQHKKKQNFSHNKDNDNTFIPNQLQNKKNKGSQQDDKVDDKRTSTILSKEIDYRLYKCPNCTLQFDFFSRYNSYVGRVPLILNCKHTLCQDCIFKLGKDCSVLCPVCKNPSVLPSKYISDDLQDIFSPNFFLIGFITWCKAQGNNPNFMTLVPVQNPLSKKKPSQVLSPLSSQQSATEICCFLSCNKPATLHCQDCSDVYCSDCSKNVHKSAKSLWSHKQSPLNVSTKGTLELEKCSEHNMDLEFYCTTCKTTACCYCLVEKHESHARENLVKLTEEEMKELQTNKINAKKILKQLLISQRRLRDLYSCSTSNIEKKISSFFVNYHAKLQFIEKNLKKELANYSSGGIAIEDVNELNNKLLTYIEDLTNVVAYSETMEIKKLNLQELFKRLKKVQDVPSYLISNSGKGLEPLEFDVDKIANDIEEFFKITKSDSCNFILVTEDDLPLDFEKDLLEQYESDVESTISSIGKVAPEEEKPKKKHQKRAIVNQVPLDNEMVEITHIESLECFYVRLKKIQYQFSQMNRDINDYIKMGAPTVEHPELNELYLVMYQTKSEKIWCRGRVVEVKNGETEPLYEVFFIDYGSTQTVDISRLRQITSSLAEKKPFAIHCELYNPSMMTWGKNAHVYMGKMLNGKQVTMLVKKVHSGVHEVDLMIMSSDRGQTSIIDIMIHTCNNTWSTNSDNDSVASNQKITFNTGYKIFGNSTEFHKLQEEKVIIVNVIDPHHIFVHLASHAETLKRLNESLKIRYKSSQRNTCHPVEGTYVIVDYKDHIRGNLHRGLIKRVDFEKCHVLLVDWGLNIVVPWSSIRAIQEEFIRLESQAILVKLAHVEPIDKGTWLESASTFLQKYYRTQDVMRMIVYDTDPLEVGLFEIVGDVDISVNALLVEENYAESTGKISQTIQWPRGDAEIENFTDDDGLVASLLKQVEYLEDDSEDEETKVLLVKQKIEIVKFVSPDLIYIKLELNEPTEMTLYKELQIQYSKERTTKTHWENEEQCVVLYNLSYSRAKIVEKVEERKYKVNVVDRAVITVLPLEKIFEFNKYFNKFPNVVFKSHLADIRPAGGEKWSGSSIEALERMFDKYKDIYGTKVAGDTKDKSMPMHMWYTQVKMGGALEASQTKFISLNNLLVKLGFAYKMTYNKPESVSSNKSSRKSTDSHSESPFISAIEKTAINASSSTISDHATDQDSIPDIKDETTDPKTKEPSTSGLKEDEASVTSSKMSGKSNKSIDWNVLMEEEEKDRKKKKKKNKNDNDSPYRTQAAEITDWIPAFPIEEREFKAWITCAETGGIIYLREEKLQTVYKQMEENIKLYFDKKPKTEVKHNWEPGHLCTIQYNDYYYRGKVYKVNGPDDITAVMIDFGSDHVLSEKSLNREILYPKIPAFASKIQLERVYAKSGAWMDSDYEALLETLSEYSKIIIKGPLDVDIPSAEVFNDKGINVNETICKLCPNLVRNLQDLDNELDDAVVIEEIDDAAVIIEETTEAVKEDSPPVDTTKYKYKLLHLPDKIADEKIEVSIMFIVAYNKIAIKETKTITDEFFLLGDRIQEDIHKQPVIEKVEVGMPCVCPFAEDGRWYRAQIYDTNGMEDCEFVFVFFVDFGNVESVAVGDIKMMRPEWFELPVSCHIAELNISINTDKNIQHVTQHMKKLYGKNKLAEVLSKDPLRVSLHELDGELCYQSLLQKGLIKVIV